MYSETTVVVVQWRRWRGGSSSMKRGGPDLMNIHDHPFSTSSRLDEQNHPSFATTQLHTAMMITYSHGS